MSKPFVIFMSGIVVAVITGFVILLMEGLKIADARHDRFMSQCMQDRKEYECTAMWRAGNSTAPSVIVVPSGRL